MNTIVRKLNIPGLKNTPVAVVPINVWEAMRSAILDMQEDLEMYSSLNYKKSIAKVRKSKKSYSGAEVRKKLGL